MKKTKEGTLGLAVIFDVSAIGLRINTLTHFLIFIQNIACPCPKKMQLKGRQMISQGPNTGIGLSAHIYSSKKKNTTLTTGLSYQIAIFFSWQVGKL